MSRNLHAAATGSSAAAISSQLGFFASMSAILAIVPALLALLILTAAPVKGETVNGRIVAQDLNGGQGYTVLQVWGSHYDMGYAYGSLMAEWVDLAYQQFYAAYGYVWPQARDKAAAWSWEPPECEDEFQGIMDGVHAMIPESALDVLDIKVACTFGDWAYSAACRSTSCWGQWPEDPYETLSIRKLQFMTLPGSISQQWHHVVCAWDPDDGSPRWVNFGFPASVSAVTGVNEFGTMASLHDWNSNSGPNYPDALPRTMACRWMLTMDLDPEPMNHLLQVFNALAPYHAATGGFLNYYVPNGGAGVIKSSKTSGFYDYRVPQAVWMDGEVISTNNSDIDGTYGISPWVDYYNTLNPETGPWATPGGLWDAGYQSSDMHIVECGYRGQDDIAFWFTGRLQSGVLDRLSLEWIELFLDPSGVRGQDPLISNDGTIRALPAYPNPAGGGRSERFVHIPVALSGPNPPAELGLEIYTLDGRKVRVLRGIPVGHMDGQGAGLQVTFAWDGRDAHGSPVPHGVYFYRTAAGGWGSGSAGLGHGVSDGQGRGVGTERASGPVTVVEQAAGRVVWLGE